VHNALLMHCADSHRPPCRGCNARPKQYVRAMFYCRGNAERCLEEVQIAPHATFFALTKSPSDMVSCRQDTAPSANHTRR
jgi:hypothetical protein